ncbi:winged helix-turn-helix domain-containing protein [Pseudoalteromonas denitrificans]|uniref:DNA-binding winged helix-turn-helix (WHTH) domain-containing protein n=1 Tax=Pseudoalteromonas denitrificans DSM 6059 TaxID=1123010 RepID=A0A1I1P3D5_9GAMM|nr:winged helix-turn-helix domain-containing protein [Pseudoalteromonas denitrificans]SFD04464.1 DNA-binding winged helix-turn-helix (wHTH) domain-containing protein [Pseudoalteromonas denitrificans DSM 6059]
MKPNTASATSNFSVGEFNVLSSRNLVTKDAEEILITPKMLNVLTELAMHQGKTLSKEQLILSVWGSIHTSDMVLSRAISDLRKVFGDSAKQQHYIETVTKQGYRLKKKVVWYEYQQEVVVESITDTQIKPLQVAKAWYLDLKNQVMVFLVITFSIVFLMFINQNTTHINSDNKSQIQLTYLTKDDDTERFVRFSHDGQYLAYTANNKEKAQLRIRLHSLIDNKITYVGESDTINASQKHSDISPAFSPNGFEVAYKQLSASGCYIRIFNFINLQDRELAECPYSQTHALDYSPDGKYLVTTVFNHIKKIESLVLVSLADGTFKTLSAPIHKASGHLWPRFSPDGRKIAVVHYRPNSNLWSIGLVNVKTEEYTDILVIGEEISQVVWDETGDSIYYLVVKSNDNGIWKIDLETKATHKVESISSSSLDFDEVSKKFVFIERESKFNIWQTFKSQSGDIKSEPVFKNLPQTHYPSLSSNNKMLAFVSTASGIDSLWLRMLNNNANVLLFQSNIKEKLSEPTWSFDGKKLLVSVLGPNSSRIMQFDVELGNAKQLESKNNVKMGKWSSDGNILYWYEEINGTWHIMEKNLTSGLQHIILSQPVSRFEVLDKNTLYYQKIGTSQVHSRLIKKSNMQNIKDEMLLVLRGSYTWEAKSGALFYISKSLKSKKQMLFKMNLFTGESKELFAIDTMLTLSGRHLSVKDDESHVYYTRQQKYHTDIVLMKSN